MTTPEDRGPLTIEEQHLVLSLLQDLLDENEIKRSSPYFDRAQDLLDGLSYERVWSRE